MEWLEVDDKSSEETVKEIIEKRKENKPKKEKKCRTIAAKVKDEEKEKQERRKVRKANKSKNPLKEVSKNICVYCGKELGKQDKIDFFVMAKMDKKGEDVSSSTYESLYRACQESGVSLGALRNARDKMNDFVIRRRDKVPFKLLWQNIHKDCFVCLERK